MLIKIRKGQNTAEYAIILSIVIGAVIAMQTYVSRSMKGGVKLAVDGLNNGEATQQYEPYYARSAYRTTTGDYTETESTVAGGGVSRSTTGRDVSRAGYHVVDDTAGYTP